MSAPPDQRKVTDALLALLRAAPAAVGDTVAPEGAGQQYAVLNAISGAPPEGSIGAPESGAWFCYQLRCVGVDTSTATGRSSAARWDAEALAGKLRSRFLDRDLPLEGTGWRVITRRWYPDGSVAEGKTINVNDDLWVLAVVR